MNEQNHEAVRQWQAKAQSDWDAVEILTASKRCPTDTVGIINNNQAGL